MCGGCLFALVSVLLVCSMEHFVEDCDDVVAEHLLILSLRHYIYELLCHR